MVERDRTPDAERDAAMDAAEHDAAGDPVDGGATMDAVDGPVDEGASTPPPRRRRWGRRLALSAAAVLVVVLTAAGWLVGTSSGHRVVLHQALDRVRGMLAGELTVHAIREGSLLEGATLLGVRLDASGGRPFLEADSISFRYSLWSLLRGSPTLSSVAVWGARVVVARYPGEEAMNVSGLIAPGVTALPDSASPPGEIRVRDVELHGARIDVLTPLEGPPSPRLLVKNDLRGRGRMRRISLDDLDLRVRDLIVRPGAAEPLDATVTALAVRVSALDRPLVIPSASGRLSWNTAGLILADAAIRLPSSFLSGSVRLGPDPAFGEAWGVRLDLATADMALADLAWLDSRFATGRASGRVGVLLGGKGPTVSFHDVVVDQAGSRIALNGGLRFEERIVTDGLTVVASPLALERLSPWFSWTPGAGGWLSGRLTLSGPTDALNVAGTVTLVMASGGGPTTASLDGTLHLGADPGASAFHVLMRPLAFEALKTVFPASLLTGSGEAEVRLWGRADTGIRLEARLVHMPSGAPRSSVIARGSMRREAGRWVMDVQADASPLSFTGLKLDYPALPVTGEVSGSIRAVGPLRRLALSTDLMTPGGRMIVKGAVDLEEPGAYYRIEADLDRFVASRMVDALPRPSSFTGSVFVEGAGADPTSARGTAALALVASRIGRLHVDTLDADLSIADGVLTADTLRGMLGGVRVAGGGSVGVAAGRSGEASFAFLGDSVAGLRSLVMGDTVIARDTLGVLERELLRLQGVAVDELPDLANVQVGGAVRGRLRIQGRVGELAAALEARLEGAYLGADSVGALDVHASTSDLGTTRVRYEASATGTRVRLLGRAARTLRADITGDASGGRGAVAMQPEDAGSYAAEGSFHFDSAGTEVDLASLELRMDTLTWSLARPTAIRWNSSAVSVDSLEIARAGPDPMRLVAQGTLSRNTDTNFLLSVRGLHMERLARLAQVRDTTIRGHVDLDLRIQGQGPRPRITLGLASRDPGFRHFHADSLRADMRYRNRRAAVDLQVFDGGRRVLLARGPVPVDLSLGRVPSRVAPGSMDVRVVADSLSARMVLTPLTMLRDVEGRVSGEFHLRGPLDAPVPIGEVRMDDAAWTIEALGVRHKRVSGVLTPRPDRTVDVKLTGHSGGTSTVAGTLTLSPVRNPRLDLDIGFRGFEAIDRRDVTGRISGKVHLSGTYERPFLEGSLSVDQGVLYVDEFARTAEIVDLTDPRLFEVVDTTALTARPLLAGIRNPFLDNLRVAVDLTVPRDAWLRSEDMNVEMAGELDVAYDRTSRDLVLVGELQAQRGAYTVLGRRFAVDGGTVSFPGTAGINPLLDIQAEARIRRIEGEPLKVTASVGGSLSEPRVSLSTDEQGLAESDLVSYLIFGRPSYQLATGRSAFNQLRGATGSFVTAATGATVSYVSGTLASRIAALAQQVGIDYLSISQAASFGLASGGVANSLAGTQVEVGQYIGENVFVVVVLRPVADQGSGSHLAGTRVEWALTDDVFVEGFVEDRFLRSRTLGFADLGFRQSRVMGVFIFREWGY